MHAEMNALMQPALDDELSADALRSLTAHLRTCDVCAREWDTLRVVHQRLSAAPMLMPAEGFAERVLACVATEQHAVTRPPHFAHWLLFVLGAAGVAVVSFIFSPISEWVRAFTLAELLNATLALATTLETLWSILLTVTRVSLQITGVGPLLISGLLVLVLTACWTRLVAGSSKPVAAFTGGLQ